jgi:uncharacterized protein (DUF736 family)
MEQNTKTQSDQIEIGALWKKEGKAQKFLSGTIKRSAIPQGNDDIQIVIFSNKFKKADNHPDLRMYLSKPKPVTGSASPVIPTSVKKVAKAAPEPQIEDINEELI